MSSMARLLQQHTSALQYFPAPALNNLLNLFSPLSLPLPRMGEENSPKHNYESNLPHEEASEV